MIKRRKTFRKQARHVPYSVGTGFSKREQHVTMFTVVLWVAMEAQLSLGGSGEHLTGLQLIWESKNHRDTGS